jgi:hypothetical protein
MIVDNLNQRELQELSHKSIHVEGEDYENDDDEDNYYSTNHKNYIPEQTFPFNLSQSKNTDLSNYRPMYFRNYMPNDENFTLEKLTYFEKISEIEKNYEKKVKKSVKEFLNLEKNPLSIVPKKNNVDLKRNLTKKLEKLNKKTEIAILEIIKENIERQKKELVTTGEVDILEDSKFMGNNENSVGNKLLMATNLQMNIQEEALRNEYLQEDDGDVSSDYDKGLY